MCVCVSTVVTCKCVDLDFGACTAGLLALQTLCAFVRVFWISDCVLYQRLHTFPVEVAHAFLGALLQILTCKRLVNVYVP